jgi:hypothetical protein
LAYRAREERADFVKFFKSKRDNTNRLVIPKLSSLPNKRVCLYNFKAGFHSLTPEEAERAAAHFDEEDRRVKAKA